MQPSREAGRFTSIGPYRVLGVLGQGGMGIVYRAEHEQSGRAVALKTVRAAEEAMMASIRREIHNLGRLQHPGIVQIVAQGVAGGLPWYAMELLEGATLRDRLRSAWAQTDPVAQSGMRPVSAATLPRASAPSIDVGARHAPRAAPPLGPLLALVHRLCAPLAFLHGAGLVHRDLKPENIFLRDGEHPVLVDLGISARFGGARGREELEAAGRVEGSAAYMAPEQILGELLDARADLYALGCILYECVTGSPPFAHRPGGAILLQHLYQPPLPPSLLVDGVPHALEQLILKLLEKRPRDRLGYADDVAAALEELGVKEEALESGPRPSAYLYRPELTGRSEPLCALEGALRALDLEGHGGLFLVHGESGVGKTRLVMEMARLAVQRRLQVITGQGATLGLGEPGAGAEIAAAPLSTLRPLLLAVVDRCQEGGDAEAQQLLGPRGKVLSPYEPALLDLPGQRAQPEPTPLPPDAARARILDALKETLFALAEARALVLILDDLQWADELTLSFLDLLASTGLSSFPVLLVTTHRTEETRPAIEALGRAAGATVLALGRLEDASVGAMVGGMLALREPPRPLLDLVTSSSDGNPFFIAEYLRAAIGDGMLTRDRSGQWQVQDAERAVGAAVLPLPHALSALIERRLQSLLQARRAFVAAASVLGRELESDLLMVVSGADDATTFDAIDELRVRQIFEESGPGRIRFVHDKIREIAYERIPDEERRALHRRAAEALERRYPGQHPFFPALARHFARACVHDKASMYFARAGEHARVAYANGEAIALFQAAIAEIGKLPPGSAASAELAEAEALAYESLGDVLSLVGRQQEAHEALRSALARVKPRRALRRAQLLRKSAKTLETCHKHEEAREAYAEAEAALGAPPEDAGHPGLGAAYWHEWIQIQVERGWVHYWLAEVDAMRALVERVRPSVEARGTPAQRARFFQSIVTMNLRRDRYRIADETIHFARLSLGASLETKNPSEIALARFMLGFQLVFHGDLDEAMVTLLAGLTDAEHIGDVTLQSRCLTYITAIHRRRGDVAETERWAERSVHVATAAKMLDYVGAGRANLAWAARGRGDTAAAEALAREAVDIWTQLSPVYPYPVQWTALLLLLSFDLDAGRVAQGVARARAMLDPKQQRLPEALTEELEGSVDAWERGDSVDARARLSAALASGTRLHYL